MKFSNRFYRSVEIGALGLAAISAVILMLSASGWVLHFDVLYLWVLLPYGTFFVISLLVNARKLSSIIPVVTCITSLLMFFFSLVVYVDGMFIHTSSTSSLLFLFVPLYLLLGAPLVLVVILVLSKLRR